MRPNRRSERRGRGTGINRLGAGLIVLSVWSCTELLAQEKPGKDRDPVLAGRADG